MYGLSNPLRVNGWWPSFTGWIGVMFFNKLQSAAEKNITSQILELDWMSRNPYGKFDNRSQQIDASASIPREPAPRNYRTCAHRIKSSLASCNVQGFPWDAGRKTVEMVPVSTAWTWAPQKLVANTSRESLKPALLQDHGPRGLDPHGWS